MKISDRVVKIILISVIAVFVICLLCYIVFLSLSLRVVINERNFVKKQLNNPYINSDYEGWASWDIPQIGLLRYPNEWHLSQSANGCTLVSEDGSITGYGTDIYTTDAVYSSTDDFLGSIYGCSKDMVQYSSEQFGGITHIHGGYFSKWNVGEHLVYNIVLPVEGANIVNQYFVISFTANQFDSEETFRQLAEAIIYAYAFSCKA